jgi:hypothetical protein
MSAAHALKAARDAGIDMSVDGDDLLLAASEAPPIQVLDQIREHKAEILAAVRDEGKNEPDEYFCEECGAQASFGYGVSIKNGRRGRWFCGPHRPPQLTANAWLARPDGEQSGNEK